MHLLEVVAYARCTTEKNGKANLHIGAGVLPGGRVQEGGREHGGRLDFVLHEYRRQLRDVADPHIEGRTQVWHVGNGSLSMLSSLNHLPSNAIFSLLRQRRGHMPGRSSPRCATGGGPGRRGARARCRCCPCRMWTCRELRFICNT